MTTPITHAWLESYRDWGSPISEAKDVGGGYTMQTFARAVVSFNDAAGITVETGAG